MPSGIYTHKPCSEETKRKIANSNMGKKRSEETKRKIGLANKGRNHTKEWKQKKSEKMKNNKYALGYKHTKEAKKKIGLAKKGHKFNLGKKHSEEWKIKRSKLLIDNKHALGYKHTKKSRRKNSDSHKGKMPKNIMTSGKFGNVQRGYFNINGIEMFFRSKWEANYALYLNFLIKQKQIKRWDYEEDVFIFEKIKFGTRSYRPDFKIINNNGSVEYHEIKGWMDTRSKTKLKRMAKYYPGTKLVLVEKDSYTDIKNKLGKLLNFY